MRVISTAVRELRYAFRLFKPYAEKRKVTIFGSSRTKLEEPEYRQAAEFGRKMAVPGWMIITGAGPGIMRAGHEGAGLENSFGASIRLPWEEGTNPIMQGDKKLITFKYFFTRKLTFVRHADAIALFPGGFGTMDEGYEALTLMQTGKTRLRPLVLINPPGSAYWRTWDKHHPGASAAARSDQPGGPEPLLHDRQRRGRSQTYPAILSQLSLDALGGRQTGHPPQARPLALGHRGLERGFRGHHHAARKSMPSRRLPEEQDEAATLNMPRIAFGFNRKDYGRLRHLINVLNTL